VFVCVSVCVIFLNRGRVCVLLHSACVYVFSCIVCVCMCTCFFFMIVGAEAFFLHGLFSYNLFAYIFNGSVL